MNKQRGFTLVEAAVAIGVVAILSGIIIPLVLKNIRDAQIARAKNDLHVIAAALASEIRDTGGRPRAGNGVANGPTGAADAYWFSGGRLPTVNAHAANGVVALPNANNTPQTFENLLAIPPAAPANVMFGLPAAAAGAHVLAYRGPYLGVDMAEKSDPWGNAYLLIGYNAHGEASGGPLYLVSAGPLGTINDVNLVIANNAAVAAWTYTNGSEENLVQRLN